MNKITVKKVAGKPNPPKSKAVIGNPKYEKYRSIDPSRTPAKAYMKKQP